MPGCIEERKRPSDAAPEAVREIVKDTFILDFFAADPVRG